jgi:hypothetical protein
MKIYVYGEPSIGKSEWVRRVKGVEFNSIPNKNEIENFPIVYVSNEKLSKELEETFDLILNFNKGMVIVEKMKHDN